MEIIKLIRCEFIKNFSIKKSIIIFMIMLLSIFAILKIDDFFNNYKYRYSTYLVNYDEYSSLYQEAKDNYEKKNTIVNQIVLNTFSDINDNIIYFKDNDKSYYNDLFQELIISLEDKNVFKYLIDNYKNEDILLELDNYDTSYIYGSYSNVLSNVISRLKISYELDYDELLSKYQNVTFYLDSIIDSAKSNEYYKYVDVSCSKVLSSIKDYEELYGSFNNYCNYIVKEKITDQYDYRAINAYQRRFLEQEIIMLSNIKNDTEDFSGTTFYMDNDYLTKKYINKQIEVEKKNLKIVDYAVNNNIKHDINIISNEDLGTIGLYKTSKTVMNNGLHLGVLSLIVVIIFNAGIVSREHDKGTIKLLLTKPVKRYKVLLSKLLFLIIELLLIWILGSVIIFFIAGFSYGFDDLFSSKLVLYHDTVKEVIYIFWYFKELFIGLIPIIAFLTLMFSISTITLSTTLAESLTLILVILSTFSWMLIAKARVTFLNFLNYSPFPWIDYRFVSMDSEFYLKAITRTWLNSSYGLIISIIVSITLFLITVLVYNKKDIKS
ncbi:MAG: ABC transporter permease subunit [Bacilli bacterium]|nr:ABC transporter permease subunit [Bacilli bacterium]